MAVLQAFHRPQSIEQALDLLIRYKGRAKPLAGGTSLALSTGPITEALIDLGRIGLDRITEQGNDLCVGAMVTCSALRRHLQRSNSAWPDALLDALDRLYSRVLQNQITVGGNCVMVAGWTDLPVAAWALDARFVLCSHAGERVLESDDYFKKHPTKQLGSAELLTEIRFPRCQASAYLKQGRDATDEALASVAARVDLDSDNRTIVGARVVAGAVRPMPQRLSAVEGALIGQPATTGAIASAAAESARARVSDNYRGSANYRRVLLRVLARDALQRALDRRPAASGGTR